MRSRLALAVAVLTGAFGVTGLGPAQAAAATGSISGTVTAAATGAPVAGAYVEAYERYANVPDATATTGADGTYTLSGLDPLEYTVCVDATFGAPSDPSDFGYQSQCHEDIPWIPDRFAPPFSPDPTQVTAGTDTAGVDLALQPGAVITGRTLDVDGSPISDVDVYVMPNPPTFNGLTYGTAKSSADGRYRVTGLPSSSAGLIVCFQKFGVYVPQCYRNRSWPGGNPYPKGMKPVPTQAGAVARGINAALSLPAAISGTVVDDRDGTPIRDVRVDVITGGVPPVPAFTDASGRYSFSGLVPSTGGVRVCFAASNRTRVDPPTGYAGQCAGGVPWAAGGPAPRKAAKVPLVAGGSSTADARLSVGGEIVGTVRDTSHAPLLAGVIVYDVHGNSLTAALTRRTGSYHLMNLTPGRSYVVCADAFDDYAPQCFDHQAWVPGNPPPAAAEPVTVSPGQVRELSFVLENS